MSGSLNSNPPLYCVALIPSGIHSPRARLMKSTRRFCFVLLVCTTLAQLTAVADSSYQLPATDDGLPGTGPIRRQDWFRKLWAERRSAWGRRVQQDQHAL